MIKKTIKTLAALSLLVLFITVGAAYAEKLSGDELFSRAEEMRTKEYYKSANDLYERAGIKYAKEKSFEKAEISRQKAFLMFKIHCSYPYDEKQMMEILQKDYPQATKEQMESWIKEGKTDSRVIDGKTMYFTSASNNLSYRFPEIRRLGVYRKQFEKLGDLLLMQASDHPTGVLPPMIYNPCITPARYYGECSFSFKKEDLPVDGTLRVWIPHPIQTAAQRNIELVSISPAEYWVSGPQIDNDMGSVYFEVPLAGLKKDPEFNVKFSFTHFQQRFRIDPEKVGEYDTESDLYKKYTQSGFNIQVTPEIRKRALEIVGGEKNPYLCAKKIYQYTLDNVPYSYMPHSTLDALNISESVFVEENHYGDCGSQSMYFSSLCRSLGIPARAIGGMQMLKGNASSHFWAEFYLQNYGWVPVDPTAAELVFLTDLLNKDDTQKVLDYYFGSLDQYRLIIQRDVDVPLLPRQKGTPFFRPTFQAPVAEIIGASVVEKDPQMILLSDYKYDIFPYSY